MPILGVSKCFETLKCQLFTDKRAREREIKKDKDSCKYMSGNEWLFSFIENYIQQ
jgi:hypothetical protein